MDRPRHNSAEVAPGMQSTSTSDRTPNRPPPSTAESTASATKSTERSAVVLALFGPSVGPCVGDFSTTYNRVNGRLYAATRAILFYSNLFGFERRLCLQFSDIESIEAYRSTSIRISMVDCEDHVFRKFFHRDEVLQVLQLLFSQDEARNGLAATARVLPLAGVESTPMRRSMNDMEEDEENNSMEDSTRGRFASELSQPEREVASESWNALRPRSQSVPSMNTLTAVQERSKTPLDLSLRPRMFRRSHSSLFSNGKAAAAVPSSDVPTVVESPSSPNDTGENDKSDSGLRQSPEGSSTAPPGFDMNRAWAEAKQPYNEVALENVTLPCSLEAFMDMFLSNDASFQISRYQKEQIMDKQISYSKWKKRQNADRFPPIFDRDVNFIHPLNNTVGPSQAKTNRRQCFQRFGTLGATLQNTTVVQGVPGADCFQVVDRWIIQSSGDSSVDLSVYFQISFSKFTMFKSLIQKNVKAETKKWYHEYSRFLRRALQEDDKKEEVNAPSPLVSSDSETENISEEEETKPTSWKDLALPTTSPTLLAVVVVLCLLALQIMHLQRATSSMQEKLVALQQQNMELATLMKELIATKKC